MLIYHVDANSAYLSWTAAALLEQGHGIDLREIPSAIAGDPANRHGIILTKSIPAKRRGVRTGEPIREARGKCPELEIWPPDYDLYLLCSDAMYDILCRYTPVIQRYSVDECFLDMSRVPGALADPVGLAHQIREAIKGELGFTVNVGVGPNKVLAKMASEFTKPDRVHTLWQEEIPDKLWPLPASELFMVGGATARKLQRYGIRTIGELAAAEPHFLRSFLKSHGQLVHEYANGIDPSPVISGQDNAQKGIGNSMTFPFDLRTRQELHQEALALCERTGMRLRRLGRRCSLVSVRLRTKDLLSYGHQVRIQSCICTTSEIHRISCRLIDEMWRGEPIRQMGVHVSGFTAQDQFQLSFFDRADQAKQEALERAVDEVRSFYGTTALFRGSFSNTGLKPVEGGVNDGNYLMMGGFRQQHVPAAIGPGRR